MSSRLEARPSYYGWRVVASLFVAGMMVYGVGLYAFTVFIPPLTKEFGWNRAVSGGLVSIFWLSAPLTLCASYLERRIGAFRMIATGVIMAALCMLSLGVAHSLLAMFAIRAVTGCAKIIMACGVSILVSQWFRAKFGLAIAVCFAGWQCGGLLLAPITQYLINEFEWRHASLLLGLMIGLFGLPLLFLWARTPPLSESKENVGPISMARQAAPPEDAAALFHRSATFWLAVCVTVLGSFAYGGLLTHQFALISGVGTPSSIASAALSVTAGSALLGAISMGFISDRWPYRSAMLVELTIMLCGVMGFALYLQRHESAVLFGSSLLFGISIGGFDTCVVAHMRKQATIPSFAKAFGVWYCLYLAALFVSPVIVGALYDRQSSYQVALVAMMGGLVLAMLAVFATPVTVRRRVAVSTSDIPSQRLL